MFEDNPLLWVVVTAVVGWRVKSLLDFSAQLLRSYLTPRIATAAQMLRQSFKQFVERVRISIRTR